MATYPFLASNATLPQIVRWAQDLIPILKRRDVQGGALLELTPYAVIDLPTLNIKVGTLVMVTNASGGAQPAFFDGAAWRRLTDRAVVT